ncbi:Protein CBG13769 [Caenorhabditis briggsae]|uniref:Protein CBG13769 n=1 Tax=Caenorhabditis briggsae TaxID=6238 RepID=A8XIN3_CAEBR|nr:Protein CBG13769 [Caenorhabditis briggsae]CAP32508.2 Protein CBG13769 [Caenorhabditis briggsae]
MVFSNRFGHLDIQRKSTKSRFPLLKLPKIVLLECIENLDVLEMKIDDEWTLTLPDAEPVCNLIRNDGMIGSIFESFELHADRKLELCFCFQVWNKPN